MNVSTSTSSTTKKTKPQGHSQSTTKKFKKPIIDKNIWNVFKEEEIALTDSAHSSPSIETASLVTSTSRLHESQPTENNHCESCQSVLIIMDDGFPTCPNPLCGIMNKTLLDYSPEWRYYGAGDNKNTNDPTRCGNPINPLLMESSFGCKILCNRYSSFEMKRIRKWTEWTSAPHREKSLYEEFQFISTMAQNSGIPKIFIDSAIAIHKDISEQKMFRGVNRDGIKAASIYISCRINGCPRTPHEIAEIFKLDKQSASNGCSKAVNILNNIERNVDSNQKSDFKTTSTSLFMDRYCSRLNISVELTLLSKFIAQKTDKMDILCDNTPQSSTAGILYFISSVFSLGISKSCIKNICGVSEVTIGKCFKKLMSIRDELIPPCIMKKYADKSQTLHVQVPVEHPL